ncbi:hypothetical protein LAZ67_2006239 [Cordylochernes scorpioides]|uniref:Uncharacterized protein n=1 Tax=Cordylochernes scorpioides TaxID=51811 RepID=A0ABY6K588_9ARAC|nr:hypothetical protein LAZ67_2006239 [Cordylochernes scorpioides]
MFLARAIGAVGVPVRGMAFGVRVVLVVRVSAGLVAVFVAAVVVVAVVRGVVVVFSLLVVVPVVMMAMDQQSQFQFFRKESWLGEWTVVVQKVIG